MFCLLPTLWKQQQIAILIISFFLYVNGIRNEGNNMLQQQPEQQHHQQQQQLQLQPLHATIKNSNYQRSPPSPSPSSSSLSSNSVFKPSPLLEFTLADVTMSQSYKPTYDKPKYPSSLPATSTNTHGASANIEGAAGAQTTTTKDQHDNRRYSTSYSTSNGETKFLFPNEQQQVYSIPQQQQQEQEQQYQQQHQQQQQQQQHQEYQQRQPPPQQKYQPEQQHFTEMPIYIYRDPYTNENYHYTPTEPTILEAVPQSSATYTSDHNDNAANGYKPQHQQQLQQYQPATQAHDNQEYLVQSSMTVGVHHPLQKPNTFLTSDKDVYLKRPGLVYDESYVAHPNAVVEKKRDSPQTMKANKISYDSHDYPPPSYAQQQTSNFLPTPEPERPPTPRPTQPPPPPIRRPPPSYATASPPYDPPRQDYRPRPRPPRPPPQQVSTFGRPQYQQQQYLQSSQNALPNYANNLDNYLSNKQQQQDPHYQTERPPPSYLQQQQSQQHPYYETGTPSYRPPQQHQQQASYPAYESPHYHQQPSSHPPRPSYNNYYDYQIGEVPPQSQGPVNYPYPRPPNGPYRPPPPPVQQPSGLASLVQYAPQFTSLLLGGGGGGGSSTNSNSPLGSLLGALTGAGNAQQTSSSSSSSSFNRRPINAQLIRALENIARNDDLQCVPKVVCQMIAAQTQRGQLPSFITSPAITNFLAGFPAASPALIYGRAALLGISGGDQSCHHTYVKCPKNEVEIIYYLNNHRGGFFKFFSEPEPQPSQNPQTQDAPQSSLFSILAALTGAEQTPSPTTPRPRPKPQPAPSSDITSTIGNFFTNLLSDYMGDGAIVEYQRRRRRRSAERRVRFVNSDEDEHYEFSSNNEDYNDEEDSEDTQQTVEFSYQPEYSRDEDQGYSETQPRVVHAPSEKDNRFKFFPGRDNIAEGSGKISEDIKSLIQRFNEFNMGRKLKFPTATTERQYVDVTKGSKGVNKEEDEENYSQQYTNYEADTFKKLRDSKMVTFQEDASGQKSYHNLYLDELKDLSTAESSHTGTKLVFPEREGKILNNPYYAGSYSYNHLQQNPSEESQDKFVVPNNQRPKEFNELYIPQENYQQKPPVHNEISSPLPFYSQGPQANIELTSPAGSHIYNNHVTSLSSINNYVSNSASSNNNYYGSPLNQVEFKPISPSNNYFLPTPAPETDTGSEFTNSIYPSNNFNANVKYYNQISTNTAVNSQEYSTSVTNNYNSGNYNSHRPLQNPPSSSSYTPSDNNNYNQGSYNSYRPLRKPSYSSSSNSGTSVNYNSGNYNSYRPQSYTSSASNSLNTNNAHNSVHSQSYPSNTYSQNNRYHSSFYTTRRPSTTTTARNDNVYVTNGRGETEYYVTPDGRKIYL